MLSVVAYDFLRCTIAYTQNDELGGVVFFTAKLFSPGSSISGFQVTGDLGADGQGTVQAEDLGVDGVTGLFRAMQHSHGAFDSLIKCLCCFISSC